MVGIRSSLLIVLVFWILAGRIHGVASTNCFSAIYGFGDSLTDTGNAVISSPGIFHSIDSLPYGETYFGHATGRCSNGRLVIDFLADSLGFPFLPPFLKVGNLSFSSRAKGVNFAVAGATALNSLTLNRRLIFTQTSLSLDEQMGWFNQLKQLTCTQNSVCQDHFSKALYVFGEIGANDYLDATFIQKPFAQIESLTPLIIDRVHAALEGLIEQGAKYILVQGLPPLGCSPAVLTVYHSSAGGYDEKGCLISFNQLVQNHNSLLQQTMHQLQEKYSETTIIYANYYKLSFDILSNPSASGFTETFETCCGSGGGPYNFNPLSLCGSSSSVVACQDPKTYMNWDGIHLTEAVYQIAANSLTNSEYTNPPLGTLMDRSCS